LISETLRDALLSLGIPDVVIRGLGDLCAAPSQDAPERKFLGSSLYVAKDVVLYQASLLRWMDLSLIPRYLGAPSREPQYRQGRDHLDFVTNLPSSPEWAPANLEAELNRRLARF
jgi:lipoate-protein ligase A